MFLQTDVRSWPKKLYHAGAEKSRGFLESTQSLHNSSNVMIVWNYAVLVNYAVFTWYYALVGNKREGKQWRATPSPLKSSSRSLAKCGITAQLQRLTRWVRTKSRLLQSAWLKSSQTSTMQNIAFTAMRSTVGMRSSKSVALPSKQQQHNNKQSACNGRFYYRRKKLTCPNLAEKL